MNAVQQESMKSLGSYSFLPHRLSVVLGEGIGVAPQRLNAILLHCIHVSSRASRNVQRDNDRTSKPPVREEAWVDNEALWCCRSLTFTCCLCSRWLSGLLTLADLARVF